MLNYSWTDSFESNNLSRILTYSEATAAIKDSWCTMLGISAEDMGKQQTMSVRQSAQMDGMGNIIFLLSYKNGALVASVWEKFYQDFVERARNTGDLYGKNYEELKILMEKAYQKEGVLDSPVDTYYLLSTQKLRVRNAQSRWLLPSDESKYNHFVAQVDLGEKGVNIEFHNPLHRNYGLFEGEKLVALWNYELSHADLMANIGIITLPEARGKWYATELVSALTHDILAEGYVPQYRARHDNPASWNIAASLWFEKIIETYWLTPPSV